MNKQFSIYYLDGFGDQKRYIQCVYNTREEAEKEIKLLDNPKELNLFVDYY